MDGLPTGPAGTERGSASLQGRPGFRDSEKAPCFGRGHPRLHTIKVAFTFHQHPQARRTWPQACPCSATVPPPGACCCSSCGADAREPSRLMNQRVHDSSLRPPAQAHSSLEALARFRITSTWTTLQRDSRYNQPAAQSGRLTGSSQSYRTRKP